MIGAWQGDLIDKLLCGCDRTSVEGGDPARQRVDEAVELCVRQCAVDVTVSLCGLAVEVICAENNFKRAAAADERRQPQMRSCAASSAASKRDYSQTSVR